MDKFTVYIVKCPIYSYKLKGENLDQFRERALYQARDLYLNLYENAYKRLMSKEFNPLWTPDTKSVNDLDFKDDFGTVSYFYFNICLLKILSKKYKVKVVDNIPSEFKDQRYIYDFVNENDIELVTPKKRGWHKQRVKKLMYDAIQSAKKLPGSAIEKIDELKEILFLKKESPLEKSNERTIYIYVHSVGGSLKEYLNWRYSDLLEGLKGLNYNIIIVSTIDFKDSDKVGYPFININRLVSKSDLLKSFIKSNLMRLKIIGFKINENLRSHLQTEEKYFLKNLPLHFFYPICEIYGLDHLFKVGGKGLLIIKGPVNNKGASSLIFKAKKYGVRLLVISPRILTSTRFSNQYIKAHTEDQYPAIYPSSMLVYDRISYQAIENQLKEIQLYPVGIDKSPQVDLATEKHSPFVFTLVLQKRNEIKEMVEEVVEAIKGMSDIEIQLKMHPSFPVPDYLVKEYRQIPNVRILPKNTSLSEAIKHSNACITSYSTAALEFAKEGKPIIWLRNVTLNSLFFTELQNWVGINVDDSYQLKEILKRMKDDPEYYSEECKNQYKQIYQLLYQQGDRDLYTLTEVIKREIEKCGEAMGTEAI